MAIGILALAAGALFLWISSMGIGDVEPPVKQHKTVEYPFPEEI